jgi:YfiR/HmsC-like
VATGAVSVASLLCRASARSWRAWLLRLGMLALALSILPGAARAQDLPALKAAIVFNLLQFVQWPNEAVLAPGAPFAMCMARASPMWESLAALQSRSLHGQRFLQVRDWPASPQALRECHAVLVEAGGRRQPLAALAGLPILVIADADMAGEAGVIIDMRTSGERLGFNIDLGAARRSGLQISAKLLRLAGKVQE